MEYLFDYIEKNCDIGDEYKCPAKEFASRFNRYILDNKLNKSTLTMKEIKETLNSKYKHKKFRMYNGFQGFAFKPDSAELYKSVDYTIFEKIKKSKAAKKARVRRLNEKELAHGLNLHTSNLSELRNNLENNQIKYVMDDEGNILVKETVKELMPVVESLRAKDIFKDQMRKTRDERQREEVESLLKELDNGINLKRAYTSEEKIKLIDMYEKVLDEVNFSLSDYEDEDESNDDYISLEIWNEFKIILCSKPPTGFSIEKRYLWSVFFKWYQQFEDMALSLTNKLQEIANSSDNVNHTYYIRLVNTREKLWKDIYDRLISY